MQVLRRHPSARIAAADRRPRWLLLQLPRPAAVDIARARCRSAHNAAQPPGTQAGGGWLTLPVAFACSVQLPRLSPLSVPHYYDQASLAGKGKGRDGRMEYTCTDRGHCAAGASMQAQTTRAQVKSAGRGCSGMGEKTEGAIGRDGGSAGFQKHAGAARKRGTFAAPGCSQQRRISRKDEGRYIKGAVSFHGGASRAAGLRRLSPARACRAAPPAPREPRLAAPQRPRPPAGWLRPARQQGPRTLG